MTGSRPTCSIAPAAWRCWRRCVGPRRGCGGVQTSAGGGAQRSRRLGRELPKSAAPPNQDRWSNSHHGLAPDGGARRCLKCLVGDFAEEIFVGLVEFGGAVVHEITPLRLLMLQQFRQLCNVRRDAAGLVAGERSATQARRYDRPARRFATDHSGAKCEG
jgi:hypothetical protein